MDPARPQWIRNVADSHLNRSILQRLSFMCPRKVNQEGPTESVSRSVVMGENPSNHVFVNLDVERQGDVLGDSRTAPVGIALLHFDDRTDEFCARSFRAGLQSAIRAEQHAVLLLAQSFVKAKQCRRLQNDCGTEQTSGTYQECH